MSTYRIGEHYFKSDDLALEEALSRAYPAKSRPVCVCRSPGVDMYIARVAGKLILKRMPNSGAAHAPACDSYEPPPELSGLGQVMGSAIQEDPDEAQTTLKFSFSLTKVGGRAASVPSSAETDSVKTDDNKLTLRGVLHYIWDEAGLTRWAPTMSGKRNWFVIRKYLLQAAEGKTVKGVHLADVLYIPEPFNVDKKEQISQRRIACMMAATTPVRGTRRLMLVIGEVKEIAQSRYGHKIIFKHLPDSHFMMDDVLHKRLLKRFGPELSLWNTLEDTHLVAVGTFGVGSTGIASLEELALMTVTENWIPFEDAFDKMVIDAMTCAGRRFTKGLRYNLPSTRPLACLVASDTRPEPTAMYIVPPGASEDYENAVHALMAESRLSQWLWKAGSTEMPALPSVTPVA